MDNMERTALIGYLGFMVGMAAAMVGRQPASCTTFSSWLPVTLLIFLGIPSLLAYRAGQKSKDSP